jgi:hypothetical protein
MKPLDTASINVFNVSAAKKQMSLEHGGMWNNWQGKMMCAEKDLSN